MGRHSYLGNRTGRANRDPAEGYVGRYHIRYLDDKGKELSDFELAIQKDDDYYELSWIDSRLTTPKGSCETHQVPPLLP